MISLDETLTLVSFDYELDEYGVRRDTEHEAEAFCKVNSVTRAEYFQGGRNGLNPELVFTVAAVDYSGEPVCKFDGKQYVIYRTYHIPGSDYLELFVERRGGYNRQEATL